MDDFEEFKTSVYKETADGVEITRRLEWEVWELVRELQPEDVTELPQSHDRTWMNKEFLLKDEQSGFWIETCTWWKCCVHCSDENRSRTPHQLSDEEAAGQGGLTLFSTVGKCYHTASGAAEYSFVNGSVDAINFMAMFILKSHHSHFNLWHHHLDQSVATKTEVRLSTRK